ncbi:MAG: PIG-L family deacetylase [Gemmatimonadaceae bacterium]|nr:PIG-L family deacetylase [Gemmatimonadaceae bacterium]
MNARTVVSVLAGVALLAPVAMAAQTGVTAERGAAALGSVLDGLGTTGRVLTVAAHPDDEDTQFIAWLTRGRHVETAYLSLTRGDGGQNLIGNELGEALGAIRTQELLSARRLDGGRQYFSRAFDFGFSKNAEETYTHWPKDSILGDVIRVVRAFRPQVMVAFFSGTPRDGHGHHQVSGLLAREAYDLAADTVRFPVAGYGLPWTPLKFYRSARQNPAEATLRMNVGEYDALLGRSYYEIAAESRSQHKSQGFGVLQRKGVIMDAITREAARTGPANAKDETSLFDGVDTTWAPLRAKLPSMAQLQLDSALTLIGTVRRAYRADDPTPIIVPLAAALRLLRAARSALPTSPAVLFAGTAGMTPRISPRRATDADPALWDALQLAIGRAERALALAAGVAVEATAPRAVFPVREARKTNVGDSLPVTVTVFNRGRVPVTMAYAGMRDYAQPAGGFPEKNVPIAPDSALTFQRWAVAFEPASPWWRMNGRKQQDWFQAPIDANDEATSEDRTATVVRASVIIAGEMVGVTTPVVNRFADPIRGDQQVPVSAVPGITVGLASAIEYMRAGVPVEREIPVRIQSAYDSATTVRVRLDLPEGLKADSAERVRVLPRDGSAVVVFRVTGMVPVGRHIVGAFAQHEKVESMSGYYTIAYDHITPQRLYGTSGMYLSAVSVKIPPRARVGYITGSGDLGLEALRQLDVAVEKIEPSAIAGTDLSRFTSIVVGPRAYESSDELVRQNPRLLDYAKRGGTLVVQYGAQDMSKYPVTPYPLQWTRPAARVTMEQAPVTVLQPTSPLLTVPNKIGDDDWKDWVQERATYMPTTIDPRYTPLLSMNDPEEPTNRGALLVAPVGKGRYVYVTLALFRQLPNGVPGAARILLNLINAAPMAVPPKM